MSSISPTTPHPPNRTGRAASPRPPTSLRRAKNREVDQRVLAEQTGSGTERLPPQTVSGHSGYSGYSGSSSDTAHSPLLRYRYVLNGSGHLANVPGGLGNGKWPLGSELKVLVLLQKAAPSQPVWSQRNTNLVTITANTGAPALGIHEGRQLPPFSSETQRESGGSRGGSLKWSQAEVYLHAVLMEPGGREEEEGLSVGPSGLTELDRPTLHPHHPLA
ncbi:hypothetical protein COCON_G00142190 [Conger conger]|uniref:Uncharacterized protein n=1 Tax=Conger conger TaxID=82655 RepID=A0A9Q1DB37_CONCO|nr:hypothetical protein COCON_G00142190 [Conger conger]